MKQRSDVGRDADGWTWVTSDMAALHLRGLGVEIAPATVRSWARRGRVRRSEGAKFRRLVCLEDVQQCALRVQSVAHR